MTADRATLPAARPDLIIRPLGERGAYVVKDPRSGSYYHLGEEEHFLLGQLSGGRDFAAVSAAFSERFGQDLTAEDLDDFIEMARTQELLLPPGGAIPAMATERRTWEPPRARGNLLFWRVRIVDPDRLFTRLAPALWFLWTPAFLVGSALSIMAAACLLWLNRYDAAGTITGALRWQTAVQMWLIWVVVIGLHECAHGLTCKHYGGEVHEIGFLLILFMPCFYCNVSDAWLFREKSRRLWVTLAGSYCELFIWSLTVFAWRLTPAGTLVHQLAFVIVTACGVRTLFNLNPVVRLDGYYLLSDWAEIPNLQTRSREYLMAWVRRLLWGASRPERESRGRFLVIYGLANVGFSLFIVLIMLAGVVQLAGTRWGGLAAVVMMGLAGWSLVGLFRGFSAGEISKMLQFRRKRAVLGAVLAAAVIGALCVIPVEDRASGAFVLRATAHAEVRAPVAGFLCELAADEGEAVHEGDVIARLEVPDLASRTTEKGAEVQEARARLQLLLAGARPEDVREQQLRVQRARDWRNLAQEDLARAKKALAEDLVRLAKQIEQHNADLEFTDEILRMYRKLSQTGATATIEVHEMIRQRRVARAMLEQAQAQKQSREILGVHEAQAELARREKELADAEATLTLMKVPPRSEEVLAEQARVARLEEELRYLTGLRDRLVVTCPIAGVISTAHLKEKRGQYVKEGDLICQIEDLAEIEAEIALPEEQVARVQPGQAVTLKVRSLPFETYAAQVQRTAPTVRADPNRPAGSGEGQGVVSISCRLSNSAAELRPGMNGYARIALGQRSAAGYLLDRVLRLVRTEFWW
jgi:multidrug efflux pump subunit AcrA (membrane-fusion protein)